MESESTFVDTHTAEGWEEWHGRNFEVTDEGVGVAREAAFTYVSPERVVTERPAGFETVDVDPDVCGHLYLLDADGDLHRYDSERESVRRLRCVRRDGDRSGIPEALSVTGDTVFIAVAPTDETGDGPGANAHVHALSAHLLQTRWTADGPPEAPFANPVQVVEGGTAGDVYVLDRGSREGEGFVASVKRDGTARLAVNDLRSPKDIAVSDGTLYILDAGPGEASVLKRFEADGGAEPADGGTTDVVVTDVPVGAACIEAVIEDELVVGLDPDAPGEKTLFRYLLDDDIFERLPSFKQSCVRLRNGEGTDERTSGLYAIDGDERAVHFLEAVRRNRPTASDRYDARVVNRLDSGSPGTRWHRVTLGLQSEAPGTQVRLHYAATDDGDVGEADIEWTGLDRPASRDALLEAADGRYLWVALELTGSEYTSPRVASFRAYFHRDSYLRYLPTIYREDKENEDFLRRFLAIFENTFAGVDEEIAGLTRYLDPHGIPPEYLSWLGGWLAVAADEDWSEQARRRLIDEAPQLFKKRGTREGLLELLGIYLGGIEIPARSWQDAREREAATIEEGVAAGYLTEEEGRRLFERYETLATENEREQGERYHSLLEYADLDCADGDARESFTRLLCCPQQFLVLVGPFVDDEQARTVERIVENEQPAHATGTAVTLRPWAQLGGHAYLGVNSTLPARDFVLETSGLGRDSVLVERERDAQLGLKSRIGKDTNLS